MELEELAHKIQLFEDLEAIKRLKHQYCTYCDSQYDADGIAALFVEDGVWDGGAFGRCVGREAIREFFRGASKVLTLAAHHVMNPIIDIAVDRATGEWKLLQPCTQETNGGPRAMWLVANYHDEYIRTTAGWKFQSLRVDILFFAPHQNGWIKTPGNRRVHRLSSPQAIERAAKGSRHRGTANSKGHTMKLTADQLAHTYSIVARDRATGQLGAAV